MTHGSPSAIYPNIFTMIHQQHGYRELAKVAEADIIIVGHSHEQFLREIENVSFINPGSVGRPYDGKPQAAYAIVSFNPFCVEFKRVDYSVESAAQAMRKKKLPESFAQMLLRGLSFEAFKKEDCARKLEMEQNCLKMTEINKKNCSEIPTRHKPLKASTTHCLENLRRSSGFTSSWQTRKMLAGMCSNTS